MKNYRQYLNESHTTKEQLFDYLDMIFEKMETTISNDISEDILYYYQNSEIYFKFDVERGNLYINPRIWEEAIWALYDMVYKNLIYRIIREFWQERFNLKIKQVIEESDPNDLWEISWQI